MNMVLHPNNKIYYMPYIVDINNILKLDPITKIINKKILITLLIILICCLEHVHILRLLIRSIIYQENIKFLEYDPEINEIIFFGKLVNPNIRLNKMAAMSLAPNGKIYVTYSTMDNSFKYTINISVIDPQTRKLTIILNKEVNYYTEIYSLIYHPITNSFHSLVLPANDDIATIIELKFNTNEIIETPIGYLNSFDIRGTLAPNGNIYYFLLKNNNIKYICEYNPISKRVKKISMPIIVDCGHLVQLILHPNGKFYTNLYNPIFQILEIDLGCKLKNPNMALSPYYNKF
jgi:DNA-binding beta-propeller fold protein YncE